MLKRLKNNKWIVPLLYVVTGVLSIAWYLPARAIMINQSAWVMIIKSNITFNFLLLFFMWGLASDNMSKKLKWRTNSWRSWVLFFVGLVIIMAIFKLCGYKTIFDK